MARIKIHRSFGAVPNDLLNNPEISFKAKGLYAYLNSKPSDWDFSIESIARQNKEGMDAIRSAIHELEQSGYLVRQRYHNEKGHWEIDYILYDCPSHADDASVGNPNGGEPTQYTKKELTKKDIIKKEKDIIEKQENQEAVEAVVGMINQIAGTQFKASNKETHRMITARLGEYGKQALLDVVQHKAAWLKDDKMREYYRPSTLFRPTHFENYLNVARREGFNAGAHVNNPDFKLGAKRYRPREEFATYKQYLENCQKYGHTPEKECI